MRSGRSRHLAITALFGLLGAACGSSSDGAPFDSAPTVNAAPTIDADDALTPTPTVAVTPTTTAASSTTVTSTTVAATTSTPPTTIETTTTPTTTPTTTETTTEASTEASTETTTPDSAAPDPAATLPEPTIDPAFPETSAAFDRLARDNRVASVTVRRNGEILFAQASGALIDATPATPDSPMLVASVSKVVTAYGIARLQQQGEIILEAPMPWATIGIDPHPGWADVTVRELLDHTSGMPVARTTWFTGEGDCRGHLPSLVRSAPQSHRGTWRYSNGNYCALGLLIETLTGAPLDVALQQLVFDPIGVEGLHLSTDGLLPTDAPHGGNPDRLSRLGGAGTFVVSTDDLTAMVANTSWDDYETIKTPGVFFDQYGWGHTGTVIGALSCIWTLDHSRVVVAATIAGNSPDKGGGVCDRVVPAVANDLGIGQGRPNRTP